jgi:hypothetical protein
MKRETHIVFGITRWYYYQKKVKPVLETHAAEYSRVSNDL